MIDFYSQKIKNLKEKSLYRFPTITNNLAKNISERLEKNNKNKQNLISFSSNDYLNLCHNKKVKKAAIRAIKKYGTGSGSSRYIVGNNFLYQKLEEKLAKFKKFQDSLVFSSGYSCAIGIIPALVSKNDLILADKLIHSSLIDGSKLSGAKLLRFKHNDVNHAKKLLEENRQNFQKCIIITENIFSMDGDKGKIDELLKIAKKYNSLLICDDAHGLFIQEEITPIKTHNYLQIGTLSKSIGALGGYICGSKKMIDYLRNFSKSQIYSTALPPSILASAIASLEILEKNNQKNNLFSFCKKRSETFSLGKKALENAKFFAEKLNLKEPESAIIVIIIDDNKKVLEIAQNVEKLGFLISAIRQPTVDKARLRITFSANHKKSQIEKLAKIILDEIQK